MSGLFAQQRGKRMVRSYSFTKRKVSLQTAEEKPALWSLFQHHTFKTK